MGGVRDGLGRDGHLSRGQLCHQTDGHAPALARMLAYFNRSRQKTYGRSVGRSVGRVVNHVKSYAFPPPTSHEWEGSFKKRSRSIYSYLPSFLHRSSINTVEWHNYQRVYASPAPLECLTLLISNKEPSLINLSSVSLASDNKFSILLGAGDRAINTF